MKSKATIKKEESMFNGDLPIVKANVTVAYSKETGYIKEVIDVEVLTVNFNSGSMRVRYLKKIFGDEASIQTADISNTPFMEKYFSWI